MPRSRTIGFPRESAPDERRTLLTPHLAHALTDAGFRVIAEPGIGCGIDQDDTVLSDVDICGPEHVWSAPLILRYKAGPPADLDRLAPGQAIGAIFHAEGDPDMLTALTRGRVTAFSYEFLREHDGFPLAVSGGRIAGIQAVLTGSQALQHVEGCGVLLGGLPGAAPARVVIIGSGNVGAAAAHTAAHLGAHVTVLTRTTNGANTYAHRAPAGVRVEVNTPDRLAELLTTADLVVGAILVSTHTTPPMVTRDHLATMRPGAVIVDATCGYGDGYLPTAGPIQEPGDPPQIVEGVLHVKRDAFPKSVPVTASHAFARAAAPYLLRLAHYVLDGVDDPAIQSAMIADRGGLVHPVVREHAELYTRGRGA
ncbi:hypothetical protein EFW17_02300 [Halostreptopolyspora alba]|uniref:Uncharacterized protein n=1 Tax=Halostreptopolyspora alba TaxID=2487137 RepID=A0A3N0EGT7_9ACTN|nr:hypothetical protein EFW17_02300 [Nocardiopsaceae bacterium YIM 96095]